MGCVQSPCSSQVVCFTLACAFCSCEIKDFYVAIVVLLPKTSYSSQAKQYGKQATNAFSNMLAIEDNYDLNKWILRQKAVKTYGAINVRMGEGGSAMDLLQESAKNVGIEQYKLHEQYLMNKYQAYKDYRKAKASQKAAQSGQIGAAIGTVAAIAAAPFTGGASLAFAGMASQVGGQVGSSLR